MDLAAGLIFLLLISIGQGEYDSLERRAEKLIPDKVKEMRNYMIDPDMYREALFHLLSYLMPTDSDNTLCSNHSSMSQVAVLNDEQWAIRMMDATTKLSDGVIQGNIMGLGSYDECLEVHGPKKQFNGQLCLVQTKGVMPTIVHNPETYEYSLLRALPIDLTIAVCVPSTCSPQDLDAHWRGVAEEFNGTAIVESFDCSVKGDITPGDFFWPAVTVLVLLLGLVLGSSWYDWTVNHQPAKNRRVLVCFSVFTSWQKLTGWTGQSDSLDVLNGMRVLAIYWIVFGHRFEQSLQVPNLTLLEMEKYATAWFMSPLLNFMLSVEMFFLISGCLLSYNFLRYREKGVRFNLLHFYYKRYIRLTPALAFVMMLEACVLFSVSDGPLWKRLVGYRVSSCVNYWWSSLLYISNYVNPFNICLLQTWYLSADMQLYILSPLLLFPLLRSFKSSFGSINKGLVLIFVCYVATTVAAFVNAYYYKLPAGAIVTIDRKTEKKYGYEYVVTHVRAASWLTGLVLGYVLHRVKSGELSVKVNRVTLTLCWVVSLTLMAVAIFSIVPFQSLEYQYNPVIDSLQLAIHRNLFSIGNAVIVFLCVINKGGPVQAFFGWKGFRPLAVLVYGVYLSHMGLQSIEFARIRQPISFDMYILWTGVLSDLVWHNLAALVIFFLVESPFWELGKCLYDPDKGGKGSKDSELPRTYINTDKEKTAL